MNAFGSFTALLVVALGYGVIVPLSPALVQRSMEGMAATSIPFHTGALGAAYLLAFAASAPFWGRAVDTGSRRSIAVGGLAGFALAFAAIVAMDAITGLYAALAFAGACAGAVVPAIQVQIGYVQGDAARARLLAILGAASFVGWFLGPTLASWSLASAPSRVEGIVPPLALVATLGATTSLVLLLAGRPPIVDPEPAIASQRWTPLSRRSLSFGLLAFTVTFGIGAFEVSLVLWLVQVLQLDARAVARMLVECTVVMMAVQVLIFLVPSTLPRRSALMFGGGFIVLAGAIAAPPLAPSAWGIGVAVAVMATAATTLQAMISLGTIAAAGRNPGAALGLQLALSSAGQGLGSLGAGALFSAAGLSFYFAGGLLALVGLGAMLIYRAPPPASG